MAGRSWWRRLLVLRAAPSSSAARTSAAGPDSGAAAHLPPRTAPRPDEPVRWIALEPTAVRRSVIIVLLAISFWLLALWLFSVTAHFLFLILLAWLLAIAMEPAIRWLVQHGTSRGLATGITGIVAILACIGLVAIFGTELAQQVSQLVVAWPNIVESSVAWANQTFHLSLNAQTITSSIDTSRLSEWGSTVAQGAFGILGTLGSLVFDLLTVIVFAFYLAAAGPGLLKSLAAWLPPDTQQVVGTVWETSTVKTGGYVISKLVLIALSAGFHAVFFWAIGLPGWLALALLAGITAQLIPMVGTYFGVIAAVLVALFEDPLDAVWVIVFATVYQQIETYVFTPRVSQRAMDVSAPIALASVFVGVAVWGPVGAIIGIPLVAAVVSLLQTYGRRYELVAQIADVDADLESAPVDVVAVDADIAAAESDSDSDADAGAAAPASSEEAR